MGYGQALTLFALWIGYGVLQSRRRPQLRAWIARFPTSRRNVIASLCFLLAVVILFAGLLGTDAIGGFRNGVMALWAWPIIAVIGLAFVHLQTLGVAILVVSIQESVTQSRLAASTSQEHSNDQDASPSA